MVSEKKTAAINEQRTNIRKPFIGKKPHTYKSEPIFKDWETKKARWEHQDKGEAAGEEDHPGRAHHLLGNDSFVFKRF